MLPLHIHKWVALVLLLVLVACQDYVKMPTPLPSATPTRTDEVVVPFESLATNYIGALPKGFGEPIIKTHFMPAPTSKELDALRSRSPQVFLVAAPPSDVATFRAWLPPQILTALAEIDYSQKIALAFFPGMGRSSTTIRRIATSRSGVLTVYAVSVDYGYGLPEETFPSHIVLIQRADVPFPIDVNTQVILELSTEIVP